MTTHSKISISNGRYIFKNGVVRLRKTIDLSIKLQSLLVDGNLREVEETYENDNPSQQKCKKNWGSSLPKWQPFQQNRHIEIGEQYYFDWLMIFLIRFRLENCTTLSKNNQSRVAHAAVFHDTMYKKYSPCQ